jgi:cytochrome P450
MEFKILFSKLLQTYAISLPEDYDVAPVQIMTLHPKDKVPCVLKPVAI